MSDQDTRPLVPRWLELIAGWSWRTLAIGLAGFAVLWLLARLAAVVLPIIIALILATLCVPAARWLRARGLPMALATTIVVVGGLAAVVGLVAAIAPSFIDQIEELRPAVEDGIQAVLTQLEGFGYDKVRLDELIQRARDTVAGSSSTIISGLVGGLAVALSGITGLALIVVLLFFFVKDGAEITGWMLARAPDHRRADVAAVGSRAWSALSGYVRGTATIAAIDALAIGIGLAIVGVPLVMPLAVLVFLGAFLPVVGALLAGLVAVLVALASGGLGTAAITLGIILAVQQLEGNVLHPMIMRRAVALHPVVVLTVLAIGASIAGIVGAFLSLPVAAVTAAVGNELRVRSEAGLLGTPQRTNPEHR